MLRFLLENKRWWAVPLALSLALFIALALLSPAPASLPFRY